MSGRTLAERLVERGLDPAELHAKASLFDAVLEAPLARRFSDATAVWWVPGRLEVFGKHTDYAGGRTLVCAVPRGMVVAASPRDDGWLHVFDARRQERVSLRADEGASTPPRTGWRHYVEVVAHRLAGNFPGSAIGADVVFGSDLPRASGMSSSSALIVGLSVALGRTAGLESRDEWRTNVRDRLDAAAYYACIENGRTFGTLTGDAGVGTHGGSEDHAAILAGRAGRLTAFKFVPMREIGGIPVPDAWRFVVAPCGVTSQKTGPAMGPYNRLAEGVQVILDLGNAAGSPAPSLGAALLGRPDAANSLRELIRRSTVEGWPAGALEKRLDHFIREDARVPAALDAFRDADAARLGELSSQSQADAEVLLGNQIPETIALAQRARDRGAFAACSFGAGFGGSVWALVERAAAPQFAAAWHPDAFTADPAPPLAELQSS